MYTDGLRFTYSVLVSVSSSWIEVSEFGAACSLAVTTNRRAFQIVFLANASHAAAVSVAVTSNQFLIVHLEQVVNQ